MSPLWCRAAPLSCHRFGAGPSRAILLPGYHASPEILPCIFLLRCYNKCITSSGRSMAYTVSEVSRFTYQIFPEEHAPAGVCRYGSSVEHWLPKPKRRVRLPLSAFFICAFLTCVSPAAQNGTRGCRTKLVRQHFFAKNKSQVCARPGSWCKIYLCD